MKVITFLIKHWKPLSYLPVLLIGVWLGGFIFPQKEYITIEVPAKEEYHPLKDTSEIAHIIPTDTGDFVVDTATRFCDMPVQERKIDVSHTIKVDGKRIDLPSWVTIKYRGIIYGYTTSVPEQEITIEVRKKLKPKFYKSVAVLFSGQKDILSEIEGGLQLGRFGIFARLSSCFSMDNSADTRQNISAMIGVKWCF